MRPLARWAIVAQAKLRIETRTPEIIGGTVVWQAQSGTVTQPFRYNRQNFRLTLGQGETTRILLLDEFGIVRGEETGSAT